MTVSAGQSILYYPSYSQTSVNPTPLLCQIESITQSNPCTVTTSISNGYNVGAKVTFRIPFIFGMQQLNTVTATVIGTSGNELTFDFDSTNFYPFAYPSPLPSAYSLPYTVPIGGAGPIPSPLPMPDQNSFEGVTYNNGLN